MTGLARWLASWAGGLGGVGGVFGGMSMALFTGYILQTTGSYSLLFAICASAYFVALGAVHLLSPKLAPVACR